MQLKKIIIMCLMHVLAIVRACAQEVFTPVEILDVDAATALFYAEGHGATEREALDNACVNVLRKVIYEGVEGFYMGRPLLQATSGAESNYWLKNLFSGKVATYKTFISGTEVIFT